jgi:hypothetical protein
MRLVDKVIDYITNRVLDSREARDRRQLQEQCAAADRHFEAKAEAARLATDALAETFGVSGMMRDMG